MKDEGGLKFDLCTLCFELCALFLAVEIFLSRTSDFILPPPSLARQDLYTATCSSCLNLPTRLWPDSFPTNARRRSLIPRSGQRTARLLQTSRSITIEFN